MGDRQYWAARNAKKVGPFATRDEAETAALALFPKKPGRRDVASVGYGNGGPWFDIRYVNSEGKHV